MQLIYIQRIEVRRELTLWRLIASLKNLIRWMAARRQVEMLISIYMTWSRRQDIAITNINDMSCPILSDSGAQKANFIDDELLWLYPGYKKHQEYLSFQNKR